MSLYSFGMKYTGPKDALINFVLNLCIPAFFLLSETPLKLVGWGSVTMFLTPMFFCVFCFPLFFGIMNGVTARRHGWGGKPMSPLVPWFTWAVSISLLCGTVACLSFFGLAYFLNSQVPGLTVKPVALLLFQSFSSAVIGFWMQVGGVMLAARFPESVPSPGNGLVND